MIVIVDYGLGNISNVKRAIEHLGYQWYVKYLKIMNKAETIILPVGRFGDPNVQKKLNNKSQCNVLRILIRR